MEFAGYQFELSAYDGSLFSFANDAHHAFPELSHLSPDKYKIINQYIIQQPAITNDEKWSKAILLSFINIRIYWLHASHIVDDQKKYYWWVYDFTSVLKNLVLSKSFASGQITASVPTILINNVRWSGQQRHNPSLVHVPINNAGLSIPAVTLVDPMKLTELSDNNFWEEPVIGIMSKDEYWMRIYQILSHRQPQRAIFIHQLIYQHNYTQTQAGELFGISGERTRQIVAKVNRLIRNLIRIYNNIDTLQPEQPVYHDDHNLLMSHYSKIKSH